MHQGHNIPWNIISSNFRLIVNDTLYTPPRSSLCLNKSDAKTSNELKYFIKKFENAIQTFSATERAKYPQTFEPLLTGKLFSDELMEKYPAYLNKRNQDVKYWFKPGNTTADGNLAEAVKILLHENEIPTLLMLVQHPSIPLKELHHLSWHLGFSTVKESALRAYMFFNSAEATGILENGKYLDMQREYHSLIWEIAEPVKDYPAQQVPHQEFLQECGVIGEGYHIGVSTGKPDVGYIHTDYARLQEYLKTLFRLLYCYDVLLRECGVDPEWDIEIAKQFPLTGNVKINWDEAQQKHVLA